MPKIAFKREIEEVPAYDFRAEGKGQHCLERRYYLRGPDGVVQFVSYTGEFLEDPPPEVAEIFPLGADVGYHSPVPMYEGQEPMREECPVIGGVCYYDGSGLFAQKVQEIFDDIGEEAMWMTLEDYYHETFGGGES